MNEHAEPPKPIGLQRRLTRAYDAPIRLIAMGIFVDLAFFPVLKRLWKQR